MFSALDLATAPAHIQSRSTEAWVVQPHGTIHMFHVEGAWTAVIVFVKKGILADHPVRELSRPNQTSLNTASSGNMNTKAKEVEHRTGATAGCDLVDDSKDRHQCANYAWKISYWCPCTDIFPRFLVATSNDINITTPIYIVVVCVCLYVSLVLQRAVLTCLALLAYETSSDESY